MEPCVTLENITISYARHPAVHHLSGVFECGSLTAITGPNGGGKSTLLKALAGIIKPEQGTIHIHNTHSGRIAYLPQAADMQRDFPLSVLHMVTTGYWYKTGNFSAITPGLRKKALEALEQVGLGGCSNRSLFQLSSGQFQRALFARLIIQDASLILLDEPFTAVDAATTEHLLKIVRQWHAEKRTIICVLHDLEQIRQFFPRCLLLARECLGWENSVDLLKPERLLQTRFFQEHAPLPEICPQAV